MRIAAVVVVLFLVGCSSPPAGREPTSIVRQGLGTLPPYMAFEEVYSSTIPFVEELVHVDSSGTEQTIPASSYLCKWQGFQGPLAKTENVEVTIDSSGMWGFTATVDPTIPQGNRVLNIGCTLVNLPGHTVVTNFASWGMSVAPGHTAGTTILSEGDHIWCTLQGLGGPQLTINDTSLVTYTGTRGGTGNWTLSMSNDASNVTGRVTWVGCSNWAASSPNLTLNGFYDVYSSVHSVTPSVGSGVCGLNYVYGGMGYLTSGVYYTNTLSPNFDLKTGSGTLVNQLGGGSVWPSADGLCLYGSPE
jgi:hypothetical protein